MGRERFVLLALLALEVVVPVRYYFSRDRRDERFAWRMFSATRFESCEVAVVERLDGGAPRPVEPLSEIHAAWYAMLRRGREDVARAYLRARCQAQPSARTRLDLTCPRPADTAPTRQGWAYDCRTRGWGPP